MWNPEKHAGMRGPMGYVCDLHAMGEFIIHNFEHMHLDWVDISIVREVMVQFKEDMKSFMQRPLPDPKVVGLD
jgi:hypothetical protein